MFEKKNWKEIVITIDGMRSSRMQKAFEDAKGVRKAKVDLESLQRKI